MIAPGLNHIVLKIFGYLKDEELVTCLTIKRSWKNFIENQRFFWNRVIDKQIMTLKRLYPSLMDDQEIHAEFQRYFKKRKNLPIIKKRKILYLLCQDSQSQALLRDRSQSLMTTLYNIKSVRYVLFQFWKVYNACLKIISEILSF